MDIPPPKPAWQRANIALAAVAISAFVLALLYWAREFFIPLALATFLAYVLSPLVNWTRRRGLGRVPSVLAVVGLALAVFSTTSFFVVRQLAELSDTLADNKDNIKRKLESAKTGLFGTGESKWSKMAEELEQTLAPSATAPAESLPQKVILEPSRPTWLARLQSFIAPATEAFGLAAFAFVLVVFILLAKEDIQDRILRVVTGGRITSATRATGEATRRISRYLLAQLIVNSIFGILVTLGLMLMGVQYAILWGFIGTLMRYIPYIGTWVGVILPVGFTLAVSDGWGQPLGVFALFIGLELISNNFVEPKLYGTSMGISELALLLSAAFWSFLWGPIGLILSGPITTCLLVLGKHHREFRFLHVLLGTDPPFRTGTALYQRLAAGNAEESLRILEPTLATENPTLVFDEAVVPAFQLIKQAKMEGEFDADEEARVLTGAKSLIEELIERLRPIPLGTPGPSKNDRVRILICPLRDSLDELAARGFASTLDPEQWEVEVTSDATLSSELPALVGRFEPKLVCFAGLGPVTSAHARSLCKRLRVNFPELAILAAHWGEERSAEAVDALLAVGATAVEFSFEGVRTFLSGWRPVFTHPSSASNPNSPSQSVAVGTGAA